jgi:hypothetical protein
MRPFGAAQVRGRLTSSARHPCEALGSGCYVSSAGAYPRLSADESSLYAPAPRAHAACLECRPVRDEHLPFPHDAKRSTLVAHPFNLPACAGRPRRVSTPPSAVPGRTARAGRPRSGVERLAGADPRLLKLAPATAESAARMGPPTDRRRDRSPARDRLVATVYGPSAADGASPRCWYHATAFSCASSSARSRR